MFDSDKNIKKLNMPFKKMFCGDEYIKFIQTEFKYQEVDLLPKNGGRFT